MQQRSQVEGFERVLKGRGRFELAPVFAHHLS
jgi:hypothetical protein